MQTAASSSPAAADVLREKLASADAAIPMLPDFAFRVIDLVSDPDVSVAQLADVTSKDPVLASRLLGLANSAYFSPMSEITTVSEAIIRMGTVAVRNLVVTVCFYSRMHDRAVYGERGRPLLEHGIGTAYTARLLADLVDLDTEEAFMYGLLHDIGKLVILKAAHDMRKQTGTPVPDADLDQVIAELHPAVGAQVLGRWHLPDMLDEPILYHHDWQAAGDMRQKAAVTYFANRLSHRYGFGCPKDDAPLIEDPVCAELGITEAWLAETDQRVPGLFEVARRILG